MDKEDVKYIVDILMAISFILVVITGIFKFPGIMPKIFALSYQDPNFRIVSNIHDWTGVSITVLVFIHLGLNWVWIKAMTKNLFVKGEREK